MKIMQSVLTFNNKSLELTVKNLRVHQSVRTVLFVFATIIVGISSQCRIGHLV